MGATEAPQRPAGVGGWSRGRGIAAALVAILVVALTLVLSRLDLANELNVVRSQLNAATQEVAESEAELDELQARDRAQSGALAACRDSAALGEEARTALEAIRRGLDRGDQRAIVRGMNSVLRIDSQWAEANATCAEATAEGG